MTKVKKVGFVKEKPMTKVKQEKFVREKAFVTHQRVIINDLAEYLKAYMVDGNDRIQYKLYIGCDSQVNNRHTVFSVVVGIHKIMDGIGRGVHIIHTRETEPKHSDDRGGIFKRLWGEVERIVETAIYLQDSGFNVDDIGTHVDANVKEEFASNMIYDSAMGWLRGMGFDVKGKPEAWAATYAANKYCR